MAAGAALVIIKRMEQIGKRRSKIMA